jgi:hypothetical protein
MEFLHQLNRYSYKTLKIHFEEALGSLKNRTNWLSKHAPI